jgi:hypothetical protein
LQKKKRVKAATGKAIGAGRRAFNFTRSLDSRLVIDEKLVNGRKPLLCVGSDSIFAGNGFK